MSNKKSIIKEAAAELEQIKAYAKEQAVKQLEEKIQPKLEEMLDKKLNSSEEEVVNESVNIETDDASIEVTDTGVTVEKDGTTVTVDSEDGMGSDMEGGYEESPVADMIGAIGGEVADEEVSDEEVAFDGEIADEEVSDEEEMSDDSEEEVADEEEVSDEEEMEDEEPVEETMFEVVQEAVQFEEEDVDMGVPAEEASAEVANPFQAIMDRLESIENKLEGGSPEMGDAEGEVEVIDDTAVGEEPALDAPAMEEPAMEEPALEEPALEAPAMEEPAEETEAIQEFELSEFEEETEETFNEGDFAETEEGEEELEEMHGVSHSVSTKGQSSKFGGENNPKSQSKRISVKENTAQNESNVDELIKENKGLKKDVNEFEEAFIVLRDQIDEMQSFNAKLALANKIFLNGGLTTDEKLAINEEFSKAETVKDATAVYHRIMKEHKISLKESKVSKLQSKNINVGKSTENAKPLYESAEAKVLKESTLRQQRLAGIIKNED